MPLFLPGESPRTEEPGELQSVGLQSQTRLSDQAHGIPFMDRSLESPFVSRWIAGLFPHFNSYVQCHHEHLRASVSGAFQSMHEITRGSGMRHSLSFASCCV